MARTVTTKLGGTEWHMPASYKASKDFAEQIGDPLKMALASQSGELNLSTEDVVSAIYIGCKHAGCSKSKDEVGELMFDVGMMNYIETVGEYIGAMVAGGPERPISGSTKKKPGRG